MTDWIKEVIDNSKKEVDSWSSSKRTFIQDDIKQFYSNYTSTEKSPMNHN